MGSILVVDDDRVIREALSELLVEEGYRVAVAENGAAALRTIREGRAPDLILLDLMMPVMSGWELLEEMELPDPVLPEIPIIVISAMPAPLAAEGQRGGVKRCLRKPVDLEALLEAMHLYATKPAAITPEEDTRTSS